MFEPVSMGGPGLPVPGHAVRLIPFREEDVRVLHEFRNSKEAVLAYGHHLLPESLGGTRAHIEQFRINTSSILMAIVSSPTGTTIGYCNLREIDWIARTAVAGQVIFDQNLRGRGLGTAVYRAFMGFAFTALCLHWIYTETRADNQPSLRMNHKLGGTVIGGRTHGMLLDGEYRDSVLFCHGPSAKLMSCEDLQDSTERSRPRNWRASSACIWGGSNSPAHLQAVWPAMRLRWQGYFSCLRWHLAFGTPTPLDSVALKDGPDPRIMGVIKVDPLLRKGVGLLLGECLSGADVDGSLTALVNHAFGELNLHRLEMVVPDGWDWLREGAKRLGFSAEARFPGMYYAHGSFNDARLMGLVRVD